MEPIKIEATGTTPAVTFDCNTGELELYGNSRPENIFGFYDPIIDWLKVYAKSPKDKTVFNFKLNYFNSASAKILHGIVNLLEGMKKAGHQVDVNWYYSEGDEESMESGKDYASLVSIPFNFIEVKSM
jgi:hypothetical protein